MTTEREQSQPGTPVVGYRKELDMKLKRALATGVTVVITGFALVACGDDGDGGGGGGDAGDAAGAPDDASGEEFCDVFADLGTDLDSSSSPEDQADSAHELADKLEEVGSPEGMSETERTGFEVFVGFLADVEADDIEKFSEANPTDQGSFAEALGIDEEEADDVIAFVTYAATECAQVPAP